jgi:hypothetical protein
LQGANVNTAFEAWLGQIAELDDRFAVSAGGLPFRNIKALTTGRELDHLRAIAEHEAGTPISPGGGPFLEDRLKGS